MRGHFASGRTIDYCGNVVSTPLPLVAAQLEPGLPPEGFGATIDLVTELGDSDLAWAMRSPSSRATYAWGPSRETAESRCDLILDLSGRSPLFPTHETRQGYLRADPADGAALARAIAAAGELVGTFDKPRFVQFEPGLCAHSRNRKVGCTRCLDLCLQALKV